MHKNRILFHGGGDLIGEEDICGFMSSLPLSSSSLSSLSFIIFVSKIPYSASLNEFKQ